MKLRGIIFFITAVFAFLFLSQVTARALWIQKDGHLMWLPGQVLGTSADNTYTYIIRAIPTTIPTATPIATVTPSVAAVTSSSSGPQMAAANVANLTTSSSSSSQQNLVAALLSMAADFITTDSSSSNSSVNSSSSSSEKHHRNNADGISSSSASSWTSSSSSPTSSSSSSSGAAGGGIGTQSYSSTPPVVYCGGKICSSYEICHNNFCYTKCTADNKCAGQYYCDSGACLPLPGGPPAGALAPTIEPTVNPNNRGGTTSSVSGTGGSVSSYTLPTPVNPGLRLTNTPYPTRANAFSNTTRSSGTPTAPVPTTTPIPDFLKGKTSTIVIEEGNSTTILKGEDVADLTIKVPVANAAEHQTSSAAKTKPDSQTNTDQPQPPAPAALDISLQQKTGTKYAIKQEELVVQKGKQRVTISVGDNNKGTLVLTQNDIRATVTMTMSINPNTNILTVDTPNGPMRVSIMPDDAVAIAKQLKIADANKIPSEVTLISRNSQLEYKISAIKLQKLLWLIPVAIPQDLYLSADTGGLVDIRRTGLYNFLTLFTF